MNDNKFIIGIGDGEHEYTVNGVKYVVSSKFKTFDFKNISNTLTDTISFPGTAMVKNPPANQETQETWVPFLVWEDPLEEEISIPVACLENPMDKGAWQAAVHGVAEWDTT